MLRTTHPPPPPRIEPTDGELLFRFVGDRSEEAFHRLVDRHARLVASVCRRVLWHEQDVEDAFQATFLVLVRRADELRRHDSVAAWLFQVARRISVRASDRRRRNTTAEDDVESAAKGGTPLDRLQDREEFEILARELDRLPESYRLPLILHYLEGRTRAETAEQLDCTEAAVKARLARGRRMLRRRLMRRGVALSVAFAALTVPTTTQAGLVTATTSAAVHHATGGAAGVAAAPGPLTLAQGLPTMLALPAAKTLAITGTTLAASLLVAVGVALSQPPERTGSAGPSENPGTIDSSAAASEAVDAPSTVPVAQAEKGPADEAPNDEAVGPAKPAEDARVIELLNMLAQAQLTAKTAEVEAAESHADAEKRQAELKLLEAKLAEAEKQRAVAEVQMKEAAERAKLDAEILRAALSELRTRYDAMNEKSHRKEQSLQNDLDLLSRKLQALQQIEQEREKLGEDLLGKAVTLELESTPLAEVLTFLNKDSGLNLYIDAADVARAGWDPERLGGELVTANAQDISIRSALKLVLEPHGLVATRDGDAVRIGLSDKVAREVFREKRGLDLKAIRPGEQRIVSALDEQTEMQFIDSPLSESMEYLADLHDIPVVFDEPALDDEGIPLDSPINRVISGVRLDSGLNLVLDPLGLTYVIEDEVMKVTTQTKADGILEFRVYAIGELLESGVLEAASVEELLLQQPEGKAVVAGDFVTVRQSQPAHRKTRELLEQLHRAASFGEDATPKARPMPDR